MDMTARFKAYRDLNREIDLQIERLEQLEAKAGSPSTPNLSGMPKGSSFQHDRMADTVARIADLRSEIDSLIAERDAEQKALEALIRRLPNADRRLVLRLRYLDSEEWEDVLFIAYGGKPDFNENTTTTSRGYSATTSKRWQSWRQFQETNRRIFTWTRQQYFSESEH